MRNNIGSGNTKAVGNHVFDRVDEAMKKTVIILTALALIASGCATKNRANKSRNNGWETGEQREYSVTSFDYSSIWLSSPNISGEDIVYQGIIGNNYRRIQVVFLTVERSENDSCRYNVTGKSKVNNNICRFEGYFQIEAVNPYDGDPDVPEAYSGNIYGKYKLWENREEEHSGVFEGSFSTRFDAIEGYDVFLSMNRGHEIFEGINDFIGTWTSYETDESKICNWGWRIPPNANNLFRHRENDAYNFNYKYLDQGWESYVYGGGVFAVIDFENGEDLEDDIDVDDLEALEALKERLDIFQDLEEQKWWLQE